MAANLVSSHGLDTASSAGLEAPCLLKFIISPQRFPSPLPKSVGYLPNTSTMLGNGALFFASPNFNRPLMNRISRAFGSTRS